MPDAIQNLITELDQNKVSNNAQPLVSQVDIAVAALNEIETAIGGGIVPSTIVLTDNHILVGNASNVGSDVPMSGDASIVASGALTLATSGVAAGTYGDGTHYPVITVDAKGRITTASQDAIPAGATGANPTATAGTAPVNGVATTFMRSDAAPALPAADAAGTQAGVVTIDNISIHIKANGKIATGFAHAGFAAGRYYSTFTLAHAGAFTSFSANTLRAIPFYVPFPTVFSTTAIKSNTSPGNVEWGIYNCANGVPSSLLYDFGSHSLVLNADITLTGLTIALDAGTYALAVATDVSASLVFGNQAPDTDNILGFPDTGSGINAGSWTGAWTFSAGNLPATFPSPVFAGSTGAPMIFLKL